MTATATPNPPGEPTQELVDSALDRITDATNFYEFEQAWIHGLRRLSLSASNGNDERALVLAEAGRRLKVFDEMTDDVARRSWLRQMVEEVRLHGDVLLGGELAAVTANELREAFARARPEIAQLRAAVRTGESLPAFAMRCPLAADRIRDLGRSAEGLSDSGLLALVSAEDHGLAREFAKALTPRIPLASSAPE